MTDAPHLLHVFSTFCAAGPQVRTVDLIEGHGGAFRHTVVACDDVLDAARLVADPPGVRTLAAPPTDGVLGGARGMRQLLREERPDLLLTYNWGAMDAVLAARSLGIARHVHHEDGFNFDEAEKLKARRNFTRRLTLRRTDVIVPSRVLEGIARRTWRLPRVHFVPNGVSTVQFARDVETGHAFRDEHGIPRDAYLVGAIGHLRPVKNFHRLLSAFARVDAASVGRPCHLVLVGDGSERASLEEAARALPCADRVHFTGHLADLRGTYSALDVFTLTSDSEQQPVSLLEAMSAGCAVVATDVGDIKPTLPEPARQQIVPLGPDVEERLAAGYTRLGADAELRVRLAEAGLEHVRREFSLEAMVEAYGRVWRGALQR